MPSRPVRGDLKFSHGRHAQQKSPLPSVGGGGGGDDGGSAWWNRSAAYIDGEPASDNSNAGGAGDGRPTTPLPTTLHTGVAWSFQHNENDATSHHAAHPALLQSSISVPAGRVPLATMPSSVVADTAGLMLQQQQQQAAGGRSGSFTNKAVHKHWPQEQRSLQRSITVVEQQQQLHGPLLLPHTTTTTTIPTQPAPPSLAALIAMCVERLPARHILCVSQFNKDFLYHLLNLCGRLKQRVSRNKHIEPYLAGRLMALLFFEPSTRTMCSFMAAMQRLGGAAIPLDPQSSSSQKGETLEDTVQIMSSYVDVVVVRHPERGAVQRASAVCRNKVLINAGDGVGEHPTQALLDIFTIREERGTINQLTITLLGDLKHGRTVHSLARLFTLYDIVRLNLVSPAGLEMPDDVKRAVVQAGIKVHECTDIKEVLADTDVLYVTRIQKERFESPEAYNKVAGQYVITQKLMQRAKPNAIVMHPLPRAGEISPEFDNDPRAVYFRQAEYGLYVRMALLLTLMGQPST